MKPIKIALITAAVALSAGPNPPGFYLWKHQQLQSYDRSLASKLNAQKSASEQLAKFGNHLVMVAHREGNGEAELHQKQADVFIVESGEARLVVGGQVVNGKNTAPDEIRGASIKGGQIQNLGPGDIVHIPSKVPHQLLVDSGKKFNYAIVKIDE